MKKLSALSDDAMIVVGGIEYGLMSKKDYLESRYFIDREDVPIMLADKIAQTFSWDYVLETMQDDQYEDWAKDIFYAIKTHPDVMAVEKAMNKIFSDHPTWYEGENIENDLLSISDEGD